MHPGVEPVEDADDDDGLRNGNIVSFMKPKVPTWTKEGLLEHIVEFVVAEDKVRIIIALSTLITTDEFIRHSNLLIKVPSVVS